MRAFKTVTTLVAVVLAVSGCHSGNRGDAEKYKPDSAVSSLPQVQVSPDLTAIFGNDYNSHVVAAFSAPGAESGAVALTGQSCAVAAKLPGDGAQMVTNRIPASSDDPISEPSRPEVAKAIGPSVPVAMVLGTHTVTVYCGTKGAMVGLGHVPAKVTTTGSILQLAPGSGVSELELVIASAKTLNSLR